MKLRKNKLIVTRGKGEGIMAEKGSRVFRNKYKGYMDKTKWGWDQGWEVGMSRVGRSGEGKMETTVIEQQ